MVFVAHRAAVLGAAALSYVLPSPRTRNSLHLFAN